MRHLALTISTFALLAASACTTDEDHEELHERGFPALHGDADCHCTDCEGCWHLTPKDLAIDLIVIHSTLLDGAPETMVARLPVENGRTVDLAVPGGSKDWTPTSNNGLTLRVFLDDGVLQPPQNSRMATIPLGTMDPGGFAIIMDQAEAAETIDLGGIAVLLHEEQLDSM